MNKRTDSEKLAQQRQCVSVQEAQFFDVVKRNQGKWLTNNEWAELSGLQKHPYIVVRYICQFLQMGLMLRMGARPKCWYRFAPGSEKLEIVERYREIMQVVRERKTHHLNSKQKSKKAS